MTGIETVLRRVEGLDEALLRRWIAEDWVRPARQGDGFAFREIDVARVRLILELRDDMEVGEAAMPVVLRLLDQLHRTRWQLRRLHRALHQAGPEESVRGLLQRIMARGG